jgi:5-methylcytosine-specific restriction endonuclease McrA
MKDKIKSLIKEGKNYSEISKLIGVHRTTVSKIVKELDIVPIKIKNKNCIVCDRDLGDNIKNNTKCKTCVTRLRRIRAKKKAVLYKGGKCQDCGYDKHLAALQFHHLNPKEKDFTIGYVKHKSWEFVSKELDKCILLCANCHSVRHSTYDDEKLISFL